MATYTKEEYLENGWDAAFFKGSIQRLLNGFDNDDLRALHQIWTIVHHMAGKRLDAIEAAEQA